jgi:propanediol dehydratase small subunit
VRLDEHGANDTAAFVREAVTAYAERGLLADVR